LLTWKDLAKQKLFSRQSAYRLVFDKGTEPGRAVLQDLAKFCRANKSAFHQDPRLHAVLEGRREVWLRIANHLKLSQEELWELIGEGKEQL
jgi:hypothetical protein